MHALLIPDILPGVFSFLSGSDLPAAARVCKIWTEPALNRLWRRLPSPFPLFDLLGSLVYGRYGWTFQDGLENPDWNRWLYYAKRVRWLTIKDRAMRVKGDSRVSQELMDSLRSSFAEWEGTTLIPNIECLIITCSFSPTPSFIRLFIAPSLRYLGFELQTPTGPAIDSAQEAFTALSAMKDSFSLEHLYVSRDRNPAKEEDFDEALCTFISSQPSLSHVGIHYVLSQAHFQKIVDKIPNAGFLILRGISPSTEEGFHEVFASISKHIPGLKWFSYAGHSIDQGQWGPLQARGLMALRNLEHLSISCIDIGKIDYPLIIEMGRAWPRMISLTLRQQSFRSSTLGFPPTYLEYFATAFPLLLSLDIPISFYNITSLLIPESTTLFWTSYRHDAGSIRSVPRPAQFWNLYFLDVGSSRISKQQVPIFAEFVAAITPPKVWLHSSHETDPEQVSNWGEVCLLLEKEHQILARERGYSLPVRVPPRELPQHVTLDTVLDAVTLHPL